MPESILTAALIPYFESALAADDEANSQGHESTPSMTRFEMKGPSLPSGPRDHSSLSLGKRPSLTTLAMPNTAANRTITEPLRNALTWLISRLPLENRDLLYTVVELIKSTAARSQQTKMTIGNLLLVFCPSLNMSPTLLWVLCTADDIWNGVSKTETAKGSHPDDPMQAQDAISSAPDDVKKDEEQRSDASVNSDTADPSQAPNALLAPPILKSISDASSNARQSSTPVTPGSLLDDSASYVSASEMRSAGPTRSPSPATSSAGVPPLSSSSDSLTSPSTTSEEPVSPQPAPYAISVTKKAPYSSQISLNIPDAIKLGSSPSPSLSSSPRKVSGTFPVPFPSSGETSPHSPLHSRRSISLFSFPKPKSDSTSSAGPMRMKRPSLHLLFNKKSITALSSGLPRPDSVAAASVPTFTVYTQKTDQSMDTLGAQTSTVRLPVLDTPISSSPIHMDLGNSSGESTVEGIAREPAPVRPSTEKSDLTDPLPNPHARKVSNASSVFSTPEQTPIADFYRNRSRSLLSFSSQADDADDEPSYAPRMRSPSQASQISLTPSIVLDMEGDTSEDWARSVLVATQTGTH